MFLGFNFSWRIDKQQSFGTWAAGKQKTADEKKKNKTESMVSDSNITYLQVQPHILCKNAAGGADSAWTVCAILQNSAGRAV